MTKDLSGQQLSGLLGEAAGGDGPREKRVRGRRWPWITGGVAVLAVLGAVITVVVNRNASQPKLEATLQVPAGFTVTDYAFTPGGTLAGATEPDGKSGNGGFAAWNLGTQKPLSPPAPLVRVGHAAAQPPPASAPQLTFSADGRLIAAAGGATVTVYNLATGQRLSSVPAPDARLVAMSSTGTIVTDTGRGHTIDLWHAATGAPLGSVNDPVGNFEYLAISNDGRLVAAANAHGTVLIWATATRKLVESVAPDAASAKAEGFYLVQDLAFNATGTNLAIQGNDAIRVWNIAGNKQAGNLVVSDELVGLTSSGNTVVAVNLDSGHADLIDVHSGNVTVKLQPPGDGNLSNAVLNASGTQLAGNDWGDNTIYVWSNLPG